jgi:alpha-tubulin suppressor-like RCC1 family protein
VESSPFIDNVVLKVSCGNYHSLALTENGKVFSWGQGKFGALGHGRSDNLYSPFEIPIMHELKDISAGGSHSGFLTTEETL